MQTRSKQIALTDALPGMVLHDAVLDTRGNILLPAGATLTPVLCASLQRHQIETVVVGDDSHSQAEVEAERDAGLVRLEWLFRAAGHASASAASAVDATPTLHRYVRNFRLGTPA
jgi:hypothetical protein